MKHFGEAPGRAVIEQFEHYHKQTYRNRCVIAAANAPLTLSVPVIKKNDQAIRDVRIDGRDDWQRLHLQSIASAYGTTPYFEYYQDDLEALLHQRFDFLFDLNEAARELICRLLDLHPDLSFSTAYLHEGKEVTAAGMTDLRGAIQPKSTCPFSGFSPAPYPQVFSQRFGFQSDLSILDLLFNQGPEALLTLKQSL